MTQVLDGRLADAHDTLQRLRGVVDSFPDTTISAAYGLTRLAQQSKTYHWSEAVESAVDIRRTLRPLGVEAGFGYGLLALAYHHMAQRDDSRAARQCRLWWLRAKTLVPQEGLIDRFPELWALVEDSNSPVEQDHSDESLHRRPPNNIDLAL